MVFNQPLNLEKRLPHTNAQGFGFIGARYHAAVIVRQHNNGFCGQVRAKHPFARGKEVIAVNEGKNHRALSKSCS